MSPRKDAPRTGALQIALFGGLETPKVFASGRPLLAHVDPSTAREVDHLSEQCDNSDCWFRDERGRQRAQFNYWKRSYACLCHLWLNRQVGGPVFKRKMV